MGPASGVYYIRNISTKYYLAGAGQSGDVVSASLNQPASFIVTESAGLYSVTLQSGSGLSVGLIPPGIAGDPLKWQHGQYQWNIIQVGSGVWKIRVPGDNTLSWFNDMTAPTKVIVKDEEPSDWQFIAV